MTKLLHTVSRRQFLAGAAAVLGGVAAYGAASSRITTLDLVREEVAIAIADLPRSFEEFRIGFISDIHFGSYVPSELVERAVRLLSDARVDILLLGGDYVWIPDSDLGAFGSAVNHEFERVSRHARPRAIYERFSDLICRFVPAHGIHAIFGNHDRWVSPRDCREVFRQKNISLLVNATHTVERGEDKLHISGIDDYWTGIPTVPAILSKRSPGREAHVVMAHNPDYFEELLEQTGPGIGLCLAGHTHGGQVILPVTGALTYNIEHLQYRSGLYRHPSGTSCYTTRGVGVVEIPFRVNCLPEVTVLRLQRA